MASLRFTSLLDWVDRLSFVESGSRLSELFSIAIEDVAVAVADTVGGAGMKDEMKNVPVRGSTLVFEDDDDDDDGSASRFLKPSMGICDVGTVGAGAAMDAASEGRAGMNEDIVNVPVRGKLLEDDRSMSRRSESTITVSSLRPVTVADWLVNAVGGGGVGTNEEIVNVPVRGRVVEDDRPTTGSSPASRISGTEPTILFSGPRSRSDNDVC